LDEIKLIFCTALETLEDSQIALDNERYKMSINRSYYATFYAAKALLTKKGLKSKTHSGAISQFSLHYVKEDIFDENIFKLFPNLENDREDVDYDFHTKITRKDAKSCLNDAKIFIEECKKFL
jgi:uncharacterized protein (UPF0332 family)